MGVTIPIPLCHLWVLLVLLLLPLLFFCIATVVRSVYVMESVAPCDRRDQRARHITTPTQRTSAEQWRRPSQRHCWSVSRHVARWRHCWSVSGRVAVNSSWVGRARRGRSPSTLCSDSEVSSAALRALLAGQSSSASRRQNTPGCWRPSATWRHRRHIDLLTNRLHTPCHHALHWPAQQQQEEEEEDEEEEEQEDEEEEEEEEEKEEEEKKKKKKKRCA